MSLLRLAALVLVCGLLVGCGERKLVVRQRTWLCGPWIEIETDLVAERLQIGEKQEE